MPADTHNKTIMHPDVELLYRIKELEEINHMMAHNLRGAAANIKLLTEILMDRRKESQEVSYDELAKTNENIMSDSEILECLSHSSDAMLNMLNDMMGSVNKTLKERVAIEECDVEKIVRNVTCQLNGHLIQKRAKVVLNLAVKKVRFAKKYLENTLYNLISNAVKYARPDVPIEIKITSEQQNGRTVLHVADNGLGIDIDKYGDKLFQLHQTFHTGYDSTGVGLYLTREQLEAAGGSISVKSKVNEGSDFIVVL